MFNEPITFYAFEKVPDSYAGYSELASIVDPSPEFATIEERSGSDVRISERMASEFIYRVTTRQMTSFTPTRAMYISSRFGVLSITGIREILRKVNYQFECSRIGDVTVNTGTGAGNGRLRVYYRRGIEGDTTYTLTEGIGKDLIAFDRDGIGKEPVTDTPTEISEVQWDSITGTVTLFTGDIFYENELLTFWVE